MRNCSALGVLAVLSAACGTSADPPQVPVVTYPANRTSTAWVDTGHARVAVDHGATWQGATVYLSLTWDLVAVDAASGKTRWARDVGAFWNALTFCELDDPAGGRAWAVELRSNDGGSERQYHDLRTGKPIHVPAVPQGQPVPLLGAWHGANSKLAAPLRRIVADQATYHSQVLVPMFGDLKARPDLAAIDWSRQVVVAIADGPSWNSDGYGAELFDCGEHLLLRLHDHSYQTEGPDGGGVRVQPWGLFVLPRRTPMPTVVVQHNAQNLIGGPARWRELCRFDGDGKGSASR